MSYETLAQVHSPSTFSVTLDLPKTPSEWIPGILGATAGFFVTPKHRFLGVLNGAAVVHNFWGLHKGTISKKDAVRSLGSHAVATMGALTVPAAPVAGYVIGAVAGGLIARLLGIDADGLIVSLGLDGPTADAIYTDHDTVLAVQNALASKGFNPGPLDGVMGPKTSAAIKKMQAALGADQSGIIDYGVLSALQVTPSKQAAVVKKNVESDLPIDGRPAKGWSQPTGALIPAEQRPAWQIAAIGAAAVAGVVALIAGVLALVKK